MLRFSRQATYGAEQNHGDGLKSCLHMEGEGKCALRYEDGTGGWVQSEARPYRPL